MNEELRKCTENEQLMKGLIEADSPEVLAKVFKENNIELNDGLSIDDAFRIVKEAATDELSENALEDANGGVIATATGLAAIGCLVLGAAALSFLSGFAYQTYENWKK